MIKILHSRLESPRKILVVFGKDLPFVPDFTITAESAPEVLRAEFAPCSRALEIVSYCAHAGGFRFELSEKNFPNICRAGGTDYYLCGNFNNWGAAIGDNKWKLKRDGDVWHIDVPSEVFADRRKKYLFKIACPHRWLEPRPDSPNVDRDAEGNLNLRLAPDKTGKNLVEVYLKADFDLRGGSHISAPQISDTISEIDKLPVMLTMDCEEPLGAHIENGDTVFTAFAPRADGVELVIKRIDGEAYESFEMKKIHRGVWQARLSGNLHGALYGYKVRGRNLDSLTAFEPDKLIADPFARALEKSSGLGFVVDAKTLPRPRKRFNPPHWHDLVILETHVRDLLKNAPAYIDPSEKLGFAGLAKWLKDPDCYLRRCGANCIELMPVHEFAYEHPAEYQWGYMPVNWFAPSSAYAQYPQKMSQLAEFAELVESFHAAGLAVVLDVVYNHLGNPNSLLIMGKQYFFETAIDGSLMNYSGCGNDFRSGTPVGMRLILESLKFYVEHFDVDGFRFDLAELLGVDALKTIERELKKIKPSIILIAEPWSFRGHIANALKETGFASWNDGFREFAKSYALGGGNVDGFRHFLGGSAGGVAAWPAQTVNYIESHDDMCFLDRIAQSHDNPTFEDERRYKLGYAFALLSHGIPMLAEGFDLIRTKHGLNNTYLNGDVNALDYGRALRRTGVGDWLRRLVKFRLGAQAAALRLGHPASGGFFKFFKDGESNAMGALYNADSSLRAKKIFAAFNPSIFEQSIHLEGFCLNSFRQIADIDRFEHSGLADMRLEPEVSALNMPPLSVAIWIER